jgi:Chaperone of endosialidase
MGLFDIFNTSDQQKAAQDQIGGINAGWGTLQNFFGQGKDALNQNYMAGLAPFMNNYAQGQKGTNQLYDVLGLNGPAGSDVALKTLQSTPGYAFQQEQGNNAVNANEAATGNLGSGKQALDLSKFNQGLAGTTYNNYLQSLMPFLNYSTTNAGGIGSLFSGLGNQLSNLFQGEGNAGYGAFTSMGNANANADLAGLNASGNSLNALMSGGSALLGMLPFLSDERAKEDIEPVGELADGQQVYRFRYVGDPHVHIGLLAQEVEQVAPEAVVDNFVGDLKGVDYGMATDFAASLRRFADAANDDERPPSDFGAKSLLQMAA